MFSLGIGFMRGLLGTWFSGSYLLGEVGFRRFFAWVLLGVDLLGVLLGVDLLGAVRQGCLNGVDHYR